jgi:hypothetical protein
MTKHIIDGGDRACPSIPPLRCATVLYYHYEELSHLGGAEVAGVKPP